MDTSIHQYFYYIFIAINYLWILGAAMALIYTDESSLCFEEEKLQTSVILYGGVGFFSIGLFHSLQKSYFNPRFLKIFNWIFVIFASIVTIIGIVRIGKNSDKTTWCHYLKFIDDFVTFSYIIALGVCLLYVLFFLFLEFLIILYYVLKYILYAFGNCWCRFYSCICIGVKERRFVFVAPAKRVTFLKYIKILFHENLEEDRPNMVVADQIKDQSNVSNLSEVEKKKILFSL